MATFSEGKTAAARSGVGVVQDTPVVQGGIKTSGGCGREGRKEGVGGRRGRLLLMNKADWCCATSII